MEYNEITIEKLERALHFYSMAPDGQYDVDVVVPVLEEVLRQKINEKYQFYLDKHKTSLEP